MKQNRLVLRNLIIRSMRLEKVNLDLKHLYFIRTIHKEIVYFILKRKYRIKKYSIVQISLAYIMIN